MIIAYITGLEVKTTQFGKELGNEQDKLSINSVNV
jgi:hypothetical protein